MKTTEIACVVNEQHMIINHGNIYMRECRSGFNVDQCELVKTKDTNLSLQLQNPKLTTYDCIVFVKDASLYFTNHGHEGRRRMIVITSAKHEAECSE